MSSAGRELRAILEREVRREIGRQHGGNAVALLLSGGIDSTVVGLAAHHLGYRVHAYTFQLGDRQSFDSKWAERTAEKMGWRWTCVTLPTDPRCVLRAWPFMYEKLHCRKKREFECTWPFLYVYREIVESRVLNGLNADAFFSLGRKSVKIGAAGKNSDREVFDAQRRGYCYRLARDGRSALTVNYNPSCLLQHMLLQRQRRLRDVNPFLSRSAYRFFLGFSWQELHTPRQKQPLRDAYPKELAVIGARNHQNYQLAGKIDEHFECLLDTPVNFMRRSRTIDMFTADWASKNPERVAQREEVVRALRKYAHKS